MEQSHPLVAIIVLGIGLAFLFGTIANRFRISPLVGYLLAGVAVGPFTPGPVADPELAPQLAEVGVILLMFGVGLHFSLRDLLALWTLVVPGALIQIAVSTALGMGVAHLLGWEIGSAVAFGLSLSISSTVVLTRALQTQHLVDSERGHIAIGWLIVQDMLTVIALVLMPPLALALQVVGEQSLDQIDFYELGLTFGYTLFWLFAFVALMLIFGKRLIPSLLHYIAHTGSRELFRLAVLAIALVVAYLASVGFGVSLALGAFFAGMMMSESPLSQRAAEESLPLRDAFAVLFFVSIGMLFDPTVIVRDPLPLAATVMVVFFGNGLVTFSMVRMYGYSLTTALAVGAGLAQIGEFSFVLVGLSISLGLLPDRAQDLILGASLVTILANPALHGMADIIRRRYAPPPALDEPQVTPSKSEPEEGLIPTKLENHAVLVGYGRVGQLVGERLIELGWPLLVIEDGADIVEGLRGKNIDVISGNAAEDPVLEAANLAKARVLIVAIPNGFEAGQIVEQARAANPDLDIIARAHFDAEVDHLLQHGANTVVMGEREIARTILEHTEEITPPQTTGDDPAGEQTDAEITAEHVEAEKLSEPPVVEPSPEQAVTAYNSGSEEAPAGPSTERHPVLEPEPPKVQ
jgi:CPA2 family monovalent cation:H+ antiporter-2